MIPVILVWQNNKHGVPKTIRRHALLPALPSPGDLMIPPGENDALNVRAREWDCSRDNNTVIHIALD